MRKEGLKNVDWSKNPFCCALPLIKDPEALERIRKKIEELFEPEGSENGTQMHV